MEKDKPDKYHGRNAFPRRRSQSSPSSPPSLSSLRRSAAWMHTLYRVTDKDGRDIAYTAEHKGRRADRHR